MWLDIAVVSRKKIFEENQANEIEVFDLKVWITLRWTGYRNIMQSKLENCCYLNKRINSIIFY